MNSEELLKLDNQLCFSLYVCSKEIIRKYKPLLEPLNLTYTGYITMLALWEKDEITVKELGKRLFLDSGTLTPLLKKLEAVGYLKRLRSHDDERNVYIELTEEGKKLQGQAVDIPKQMICSSKMNPEMSQELLQVLHSLMEGLQES